MTTKTQVFSVIYHRSHPRTRSNPRSPCYPRNPRLQLLLVNLLWTTPAMAQSLDTLYLGNPPIASSRIQPRWDTLDVYGLTGGHRNENDQVIQGIEDRQLGGKQVILIIERFTSRDSSDLGAVSVDTVALDAVTLAPLWDRTHAATDSAFVTYTGRHVRGFA